MQLISSLQDIKLVITNLLACTREVVENWMRLRKKKWERKRLQETE